MITEIFDFKTYMRNQATPYNQTYISEIPNQEIKPIIDELNIFLVQVINSMPKTHKLGLADVKFDVVTYQRIPSGLKITLEFSGEMYITSVKEGKSILKELIHKLNNKLIQKQCYLSNWQKIQVQNLEKDDYRKVKFNFTIILAKELS